MGNAGIWNFDINSHDELILPVDSDRRSSVFIGTQNIPVNTYDSEGLLIKLTTDSTLLDVKRTDATSVHVDSADNLLLYGNFNLPTDLNPNPFDEYMVDVSLYPVETPEGTIMVPEDKAFLVKLRECDTEPLFDNNYYFCAQSNPNPTVGDIEPNDFNISWYSSMTSSTPLPADLVLVPGQTYYYEKTNLGCPALGRFPVVILLSQKPSAPVLDVAQPCYFEGMRLSDAVLSGSDLTFYDPTTGKPISASTTILPGTNYSVTQTVGACESDRTTLNFNRWELQAEQTVGYCDDGGPATVNLSDYNSALLPANAALPGYVFSYHLTADGALNNTNQIVNTTTFPVANQPVYVRVTSLSQSCFGVVEMRFTPATIPAVTEIVVNDLAQNNSINVLTNETGLSYSIDGINFQPENFFGNLDTGQYNVYVKNQWGCVDTPKAVYVLAYPKYFSPNGDGINDIWKIDFAIFQDALDVEIYDRYGKLITRFSKEAPGWNGSLNNRPLPADDYWFRIVRVANKETISKGHFALVR
ncbi:T9SS type B sorting domain-containing protein [Flavobacterium sp. 3HN19-14]|uniref:T9SS type B sorting domain-containing protein n=1 Tax=Flavobacterium sp. 3HN19-14 TaxID=3448133 RepID=UPI003EE2AEAF